MRVLSTATDGCQELYAELRSRQAQPSSAPESGTCFALYSHAERWTCLATGCYAAFPRSISIWRVASWMYASCARPRAMPPSAFHASNLARATASNIDGSSP